MNGQKGWTYEIGVSLDTHFQIFAPHAQAVSAVAARGPLTARRTAGGNVVGLVERRKDVATFLFRNDTLWIVVAVFSGVDVVHSCSSRVVVIAGNGLRVFGWSRRRQNGLSWLPSGSFFAARVLVDVPRAAGDCGAGVAGVVRGAPVFGGRAFSDIKTLLQTGNRTVLWWGGRRWRRYLDLKKKKNSKSS